MKKLNLIFAVALMSILLLCLTSCGEPKFEYEEYSNGYKISGRGDVSDTELVIPEKYKGKPVLGIGDEAFKGCTDITSITLPDTVEFIELSAFEGCTALKTINTPSNLTMIGELAFAGCSSLEAFDIPEKMDTFVKNAFRDTPLLETEGSVTYVDNWVVGVETGLTDVSIREGTVGLAESALRTGSTKTLKDVFLPSTLKSIEIDANYSYMTFHFDGTKAQWQTIFEEYPYYTFSFTVVCTDETLTYQAP